MQSFWIKIIFYSYSFLSWSLIIRLRGSKNVFLQRNVRERAKEIKEWKLCSVVLDLYPWTRWRLDLQAHGVASKEEKGLVLGQGQGMKEWSKMECVTEPFQVAMVKEGENDRTWEERARKRGWMEMERVREKEERKESEVEEERVKCDSFFLPKFLSEFVHYS